MGIWDYLLIGMVHWNRVFPTWARKYALDRGEAVNHLKGEIVTSDRILTVSQGYAWVYWFHWKIGLPKRT